MNCYTLLQLNQFIRRFVSLNAPEGIWITAEIGQINQSKGHHYLELIQKAEESDQLLARSQAALWAKSYEQIQAKKKTAIKELLKEGLEVKLKVKIDFHETFGLKLFIEDIDENYTYGKMAIKKTEILNRLKKEKLLDLNKTTHLDPPIKKIAVISSSTAAGYEDFINHLENNVYAYQFKVLLFSTAVQGLGIEQGFLDAFEDISIYDDFDCVAIIRGGGSKIDLAGFDNYEVCKAAAKCKFPVLVGIGHEIDETLLDLVAHSSLKTPTALADCIINLNLAFESQVQNLGLDIQASAKHLIANNRLALNTLLLNIIGDANNYLRSQKDGLDLLLSKIEYMSKQAFMNETKSLKHIEETIKILDIENTLKRGFSITRLNEKAIESAKNLKEGNVLTTTFWDGEIESIVRK